MNKTSTNDQADLEWFTRSGTFRDRLEQSATISVQGTIAVTADLLPAEQRAKWPYVAIARSKSARCLILQMTDEAHDTWKWTRSDRSGMTYRIRCQGVLRRVVPDLHETVRLPAESADGRILIDLSSLPEPKQTASAAPLPLSGNPTLAIPKPPETTSPAGSTLDCRSCFYQLSGLCTNNESPANRRHKRVDAPCWREICDLFRPRKLVPPPEPVAEHPPTSQDRKPRVRHHSRPRAECPECHHELPVTKKGLLPHDANGVAYIAGRGDRANPCPGRLPGKEP